MFTLTQPQEIIVRKALLDLLLRYTYLKRDISDPITLSCGVQSLHYTDLRVSAGLIRSGSLLSLLALNSLPDEISTIFGVALGGVLLQSGIGLTSMLTGREINSVFVRKKLKGHGTASMFEGFKPNEGAKIALVEDVTTSGASALKAMRAIEEQGWNISHITGFVDRRYEVGEKALEFNNYISDRGIIYTPLFSMQEIIDFKLQQEEISFIDARSLYMNCCGVIEDPSLV